MTINDLLITPVYFFLFLALAYFFRSYFVDERTKRYFIPAFVMKFLGAISLGLVYQFYYGGGDTFNYFTHGSRWVWEAFFESPGKWVTLISAHGGQHLLETFEYTQKIWYFKDPHSYFVVRLTSIFDLLTFHTYSASSLFFATWSFLGSWSVFRTFSKIYPHNVSLIALVTLFVPSVIFWGSGILKDSVTLGALGLATQAIFGIFYFRKKILFNVLVFTFSCWVMYSVKVYVLLTFIFAISIWLYSMNIRLVKNRSMRLVLAPVIMFVFLGLAYLALNYVSTNNSRYALSKIAETAAITAHDIRYGWGARTGDTSGYDLGELDGSLGSMLRLAPAAINVSLFRPYIWEVKNPLMLLSSLEATLILLLTLRFLYKGRGNLRVLFSDPHLRFCLIFSLMFAFAVGVSTYNFGTLMRYKIQMMPFYGIFLVILRGNSK